MGKKYNNFEDIQNDIESIVDNALYETAKEVTRRSQEAYIYVIDRFYAEYTPITYNRTLSLYLGSDLGNKNLGFLNNNIFSHSIRKNKSAHGKISYSSRINIAGKYLGHPYRADTEWVFNRAFYEGIHGITEKDAKKINTTKYANYQGGTFSFIKKYPPISDPIPNNLFNDMYKKIDNDVDSIFLKKLTKRL